MRKQKYLLSTAALSAAMLVTACGEGNDTTDNTTNQNGDTNQGTEVNDTNDNSPADNNADEAVENNNLDDDTDTNADTNTDEVDNDAADNGSADNNDADEDSTAENNGGEDTSSTLAFGVREFELEIDFQDGSQWEFEYEDDNGETEAEIEKENGDESEREGSEAIDEMEAMLQELQIFPDTSEDDAIDQVLSYLEITEDELTEFELEIEYQNGDELEIERSY
ncbi:YusW family protein [Evansella sp. LMS18]|uniref:YusW family protein n=1 Tax=Evansella sp. LMS18 TaxID=2924033 RepID=UPI0020D00F71|nr:YusW family protein [Evansella sp. LMS18]UTR08653.1 YusW family protein [Evansella sp. LMS18]